MKRMLLLSFFISVFMFSCQTEKKETVHIVKSHSNNIRLNLDGEIYEEEVAFGEFAEGDIILLNAYNENYVFGIYTDVDSFESNIPMNSSMTINLVKDEYPPVVIKVKNGLDLEKLTFDSTTRDDKLKYIYEENQDSPYLRKLRAEYPIDSLANLGNTELDKARIIASWVHNLWEHDGQNVPEKNDALYILEEVKKGKRFRCVEYGIVTTACLNAIGLKSRTLSLRTKDAETRPTGAGHVVMEVFLNDLNKWIMIDPQYDLIVHLNNIPLNAVELQEAITQNKPLEFWTSEEGSQVIYIPWIYPYLYYFTFPFDNRENISSDERLLINGKSNIMLVPIGAKEPKVFQKLYPIDYCIYTHSINDFYREP